MNRKQSRESVKGKAKGPNLNDPKIAQAILEKLPVSALIAGINNSLNILQKKGVHIWDWDQKKRELYGVKVFGSKVYFLAADMSGVESKDE